MKQEDLLPLRRELREARKKSRMTQDDMATYLGMSRKTYALFESCRWVPTRQRRWHVVTKLHAVHPPAVHSLLKALGQTLDDYTFGVAASPAEAPPTLDAKQAKLAFDAALYSTAEDAELPPKVLRSVANMLLSRLADAGVTLAQAVAMAKSAVAQKK